MRKPLLVRSRRRELPAPFFELAAFIFALVLLMLWSMRLHTVTMP
jgi:hypothetical protein